MRTAEGMSYCFRNNRIRGSAKILVTPCLSFHVRKLKPQQACLAGAKAKEETQLPPEMLPERRRNVLTPPPPSSGGPPLLPHPRMWGNAGSRRKGRGGSEQTGGPPAQAPHWESHSSQWWSPSYTIAEALNPCCSQQKCSSWRRLCERK